MVFQNEYGPTVPAYERQDRVVPSSSLGVAKGTILCEAMSDFWGFVGVLPFPHLHPTNILHF